MRYEPPIVPGRHFQLRYLVDNLDKLRTERIQAAIDKKFPKLAAWKAKTVLVLEQNDIQLTNPGIVADTYAVGERQNRPAGRDIHGRGFPDRQLVYVANSDWRSLI